MDEIYLFFLGIFFVYPALGSGIVVTLMGLLGSFEMLVCPAFIIPESSFGL